jgi:hypothetical protein
MNSRRTEAITNEMSCQRRALSVNPRRLKWNRARRKQLRTKCHAIAARCHGIGAPQHGNARHIAPITGTERRLQWHLANSTWHLKNPTWHLKAMVSKRERNDGFLIARTGMRPLQHEIRAVTASERQLQHGISRR